MQPRNRLQEKPTPHPEDSEHCVPGGVQCIAQVADTREGGLQRETDNTRQSKQEDLCLPRKGNGKSK